MSKIFIQRRLGRTGFYLPMSGTEKSPSLMFLLPKADPSHLDELIRAQLEKQGVTNEADIQALSSKAEVGYEQRIKVQEARKEVRRLMELRRNGAKLMSVGNKKWKQVFHPGKQRREI